MENSIEKGTYEIIQQRLQTQRTELVSRVESLNTERKKIFGAVDFKLLSNFRINTEHNCLARDIVSIGNLCLFGYNVRLGLKTILDVDDVFSVYHFQNNEFQPLTTQIIHDTVFANELNNLYKFYRNTQFSRFLVRENFLYMIFQLSESVSDIKAFKWLIEKDQLIYMDSRSASEVRFPLQHEFEWTKATRDMQRIGKNPHISIVDKVFVETVSGNLTIKVEDNTEDGFGIYNEEVEQRDQSLDDAEVYFCDLGNLVLLKIKPYLEKERYFIFNHRIKNVVRVDTLKDAGILLPDQQGIILSNGYYLQTGENKIFDRVIQGVKFLQKIASPNGEDYLYVFYEEKNHDFVILSYNVIDQSVKTPIFCNGYTLFANGELCYFNTENDPSKNHLIQIWQTPYTFELIPNEEFKNHELYKIGNKPIVKAMAEIQELVVLLSKQDSYNGLYEDIQRKAQSIKDAYFWLKNKSVGLLIEPLQEIKKIAVTAIDEFEKVKQIKSNTAEAFITVKTKVDKILFDTKSASFDSLDAYVNLLSQMRSIRGEIIELKNLRYIDIDQVTLLEKNVAERADQLSQACVQFLLQDNALVYYQNQLIKSTGSVSDLTKVIDANALEKDFDTLSLQLELLIDIVNNLKVEDTSHATKIIENISVIFSQLNQQRVALRNKKRQLSEKEAVADFQAQMTLFEQSMVNFLDLATSPEKCDEYLTKLSIQLEELEGKFVDFDNFIEIISQKREAIYGAFESKKVSLVEARNRRTSSLFTSAERVLKGIQSRVASFTTPIEINGYFASDLMVDKIRNVAEQLRTLEDTAKSEDLENKLKVLQQEALRALKDKNELFEDGENIIKLGDYRFAVNSQKLDLTLVVKDQKFYYHLTGTSFYELVNTDVLAHFKEVWDQQLPSENKKVYRAEYLAWKVFSSLNSNEVLSADVLKEAIQQHLSQNYGEGYVKGVHDDDALAILEVLMDKKNSLGLLQYDPFTRTSAQLFWHFLPETTKKFYKKQLVSSSLMKQYFVDSKEPKHLIEALTGAMNDFSRQHILNLAFNTNEAARYLWEEQSTAGFVISTAAQDLMEAFLNDLRDKNADLVFKDAMQPLVAHPAELWQLTRQWVVSYVESNSLTTDEAIISEATVFIITQDIDILNRNFTEGNAQIPSLKSIQNENADSSYYFDYHSFGYRLHYFCTVTQPQYFELQTLKHQWIEAKRREMRLHEFEPKVLSSFVRNKLINQVYFPLIGANFAKQMGAFGQNQRTDRSGMLLLISPPGYGKTTLMEYMAERLGLIFMKINGPSIGHQITSIDPAEATNAAAKQELMKLNLAFEMSDNVMLYLDDIQHCNPEFLQKFISLADGQRKMDGVYNGVSKTYDLRGKRFCVVMAGNPYTESGEKFQIPDMLTNRADIYNLGDTAKNRLELFKLSLIENGLTSNTYLKSLTQFGLENLYKLVDYCINQETILPDLEGNFASQEVKEGIQVLKKVMFIRDIVLQVNAQYIASAAMSDDYRTEPAFKLQGSYRDMNKLMSGVVPILNDDEVMQLVLDHYQNESQMLTSDAEANLLKLFELIGVLNDTQKERWQSIKETFLKNNKFKGLGDADKMTQIIAQMSLFVDGLEGIKKVLDK
jgi:hypothetical protein